MTAPGHQFSGHPFTGRARELGRPLIIGHRGAKALETENTIEGFALAHAAGADGIELDVQQCATGELVVFHDETLARLAGRGERISSIAWNRLRQLPIGRGLSIPLLGDVLDHFDDRHFYINIEIKSPRLGRAGALVDRVLACIETHAAADRVVLSSFDPFAIGRIRRKAPTLATGFLFERGAPRIVAHAWRMPQLRPGAVHPEHVLVTAARMRSWLTRGLAVATWTANDLAEVQRLAQLGVHAIICDDPGRVRQSLE